MDCPECGKAFVNGTCGDCGWKVVSDGNCSWTTDGIACSRTGTISPSTTGDKVYCSLHYCALHNKKLLDIKSPEYLEWYKKELRYCLNHDKPVMTSEWDAHDSNQIKGLSILGTNSPAWNLAPEEMRQKALLIKDEPINNLFEGL
jgi:hypothetical protein